MPATVNAEGIKGSSVCLEQSEDSDVNCIEISDKRITNNNTKSTNSSKDKPCLNWVLDSKFKKEQARLKIPEDPNLWTVAQVKHWFQWAVRQFELVNINKCFYD